MGETATWTPGPLKPRFGETITVRAPDGSQLAILSHLTKRGRRDGNEVEATAHLFAAAPDLYEALDQIVFDWDGEPEDMADARAALAKARGGV